MLATFAATAAAKCGCGYTVNATDQSQYAVFTELMETDFLHVKDVTYNKDHNTGWMPHNYNQPAGQAGAPYGMAKQSRNLVPNYIDSPHNWLGPGVEGIDPGLQLWVRYY